LNVKTKVLAEKLGILKFSLMSFASLNFEEEEFFVKDSVIFGMSRKNWLEFEDW